LIQLVVELVPNLTDTSTSADFSAWVSNHCTIF